MRGSHHGLRGAQFSVSSRSNTEVVAKGPVVEIMPALPTWLCVARDLVLRESRLSQPIGAGLQDLRGDIVTGKVSRWLRCEDSARFECQLIVGQVCRPKRNCGVDVVQRRRDILTRKG